MKGTKNYAALSDPARNSQFSRKWAEPQHVGKVAQVAADDIVRQAISHHLAQAADLDGREAEVASAPHDAPPGSARPKETP